MSSDQEAQPAREAGQVQLVRLVDPVHLAQPAQPTPPDDGPDCEYSACRFELTNADRFDNDLEKQKRPIAGFHVSGDCPRPAWIVIFAAVAVAANAWGIYKSTLASIGFPAIKRAKSALELSNSDLWPLQQTIHAVNNLQAAVLSSALAFVAGVVAVGFVWLAPNAAAPAVTVNLMIRPPTPSPGATAGAERALASPRCPRSWWRGRVEPGPVRDKTSDESWPSF